MHSCKDFTTPTRMHILMRRCMIRDDFGIFIQLHLNLDTIRAAPQAFKCRPT